MRREPKVAWTDGAPYPNRAGRAGLQPGMHLTPWGLAWRPALIPGFFFIPARDQYVSPHAMFATTRFSHESHPMNEATKQALLSAIRSILIVLGSALVTKGVVDDATMQSIVGAVVTILPIVWGAWDKSLAEQKTKAREVVAVNAGISVANATVGLAPPIPAASVPSVIAAESAKKGST